MDTKKSFLQKAASALIEKENKKITEIKNKKNLSIKIWYNRIKVCVRKISLSIT